MSSPLVTGNSYTFYIKGNLPDNDNTGVKDAATTPNLMANTYSWTLAVDTTNPTVISYSPSTAYVKTSTPSITALFAENIASATLTTSTFTLKKGTTAQSGTTPSFDNVTNTATLSTGSLGDGTYTATLTTGITDLAGNAMLANVPWTFIVDTIAPTVTYTPASAATGVSLTSKIIATFTEANSMLASSINTTTFSVSDGTANVGGTLSYDATTKVATFTPVSLNYSTTYTVTLSGITDIAGNALPDTIWSFATQAISASNYSVMPSFISSAVKPNILIILDNSNSMDEDMNGLAIGSPHCTNYSDPNTCSRSIIARKALTDIVNSYSDKMNIALMSYKQAAASKSTLGPSFYFTSYDIKSYCPNPPPECSNYCIKEDPKTGTYTKSADESVCQSSCAAQNALFQANYRDPITTTSGTGTGTGSAVNSTRRTTYCGTVYPKTNTYTSPDGAILYYKVPGTYYGIPSTATKEYYYSSTYSSKDVTKSGSSCTNTNTYKIYTSKTGTSDSSTGYSGAAGSGAFCPTDEDYALGFYNFGQRMYDYYTTKTWSANTSPGGGWLHSPTATANAATNPFATQLTDILTKLAGNNASPAFQNDETGYMACTNTSDPNSCSYILNAGLTPTAGTLQSAMNFLNGTLTQGSTTFKTPIQNSCDKNFIIYVTDGLPSVNESGTADTADNLMPAVLTKLDGLRCPSSSPTAANCKVTKTISGATAKYDVKSYILGMGLGEDAKANLDSMAVHGGTDKSGAAYYANNATDLNNALNSIFQNILLSLSSGTAASILNNSEGSGATLLQAIFYPKKTYENNSTVTWSGELLNLWYYVDPFFGSSTIREDTDYTSGNHVMDLANDKRVQFYFDTTASQTKINRYNFNGTTELADLNSDITGGLKTVWTAGKLLWKRDLTTHARTIYTTTDSKTFTDFTHANAGNLYWRLNADGADVASKTVAAEKIIDYTLGTDVCLDASSPCNSLSRNRSVTIKVSDSTTENHIWKLGDIISSTPKIQGRYALQSYDQAPPLGYSDTTYKDYYSSTNYLNRGMVYVGANDGMLHAFKLGKMSIQNYGTQKAVLSGVNLGWEEWAFIPKNVMPYLKYLTLPDYDNNHTYLVDGTNSLLDVSTITTDASRIADGDYWNETRSVSTWKTVLFGGMGLGGASKNVTSSCTDNISSGTCVKTPFNIHGFSSYFAIDVSNQDFNQDNSNLLRTQPTLLWEFSHDELGYSTSGPAFVHLNAKSSASPFTPQPTKNGRTFAVYASGPTGPIDTSNKQFLGKSDQNLKLFIVDVEKGPVVDSDPKKNGLWIIDTGISEAFAGSISNNAVVDAEMVDKTNENLRQDDVVYIGYTRKCVTGDTGCTAGEWTNGGVLRLVIPDSSNPDVMFANVTDQTTTDAAAWKVSKVIDGIGPVTTTVSKLMSKNNLYLFFGTGRYYYPQDDMSSTRSLFMVKEKCYPVKDAGGNYVKSDIISSCDSSNTAVTTLAKSDLTSKNTPSSTAVANGWYIDLDAGERVVTDTVATVNGSVFYTSYKPTSDICGFGGTSYLWGVQYDTGNTLPSAAQKGKVLIQLSTGSFAEMDLSTALTDKNGRRTANSSALSFGKASADSGLFMTSAGLTPVKRILHIQERYK